jgi:hypothetical protein
MADEDTAQLDQVRDWRLHQLRLIGYGLRQRAALLERIEAGELELEDVRHLAELGCPVEMAWWVLS